MRNFIFKRALLVTALLCGVKGFAQEPTHPQYVKPKASNEAFETLYGS